MNQADLEQILAQHAEWLADSSKGRQADLRDVNLRGADLHNANLAGANLTDANLAGANLRYANLTDANLAGADLHNADLTGANLCGASVDPVAWVEAHERAIFLNFTQDRWVALWKDSTYTLPSEWQTFWEIFK